MRTVLPYHLRVVNLVRMDLKNRPVRSAAPARASPGRSVCAPEVETTVSPDGSRLVSYTSDGPAVHVWDVRLIRHRLAEMHLDWDAPPFTDDDPVGP
jgi:hypothetical protein